MPFVMQQLVEYPIASDENLGEILRLARGLSRGEITTLAVSKQHLLPLYNKPKTEKHLFLNEFWARKDFEPRSPHYAGLNSRVSRKRYKRRGKRIWTREFKKYPHKLKAYLARSSWD